MLAVFALCAGVCTAPGRLDVAVVVSHVRRCPQKSHYKAVFDLTHNRLWAQVREILVGNSAVK